MTLVAMCSLKGSPGVTTAAVGLAASWPTDEQPVVVECDPSGGDLLARFRLETSPGLVSLAAAGRHGDAPGLVWQHTQRLPGGLPVVVGPAGTEQARAVLAQLAAGDGGVMRRAADRAGTVVVADCGRGSADAAVVEVLRSADAVLVLSRVRDDALSHLAAALARAPGWLRRAGVVLVGDGYPTAEVADALQVPVVGRIPEDARGAALLGGAAARRSAPSRSALLRSLEPLARETAAVAHRRRGAPQPPAVPVPVPGRGVNGKPSSVSDPRQAWNGARR